MSTTLSIILALLLGLLGAVVTALPGGDDSVARFYWERARAVYRSRDPLQSGARFSFVMTVRDLRVGAGGEITRTDTVVARCFYSFGNQDSVRIIASSREGILVPSLATDMLLDSTALPYLFPNDTGAGAIAVGFDCDTLHPEHPVGLVLMDRNRFVLTWAYLSYPRREDYKRFTRSLRFTEFEGLVVPDSLWEVAMKEKFFLSTHTRTEVGFREYRVYR